MPVEQLENSNSFEEAKAKHDANHLKAWQFQPGQSGNPSGRPKGAVSLKEYAKKMLYELDEDEKLQFMKGLPKDKIWEMAEGKAKQDVESTIEVTSKVIKLDE